MRRNLADSWIAATLLEHFRHYNRVYHFYRWKEVCGFILFLIFRKWPIALTSSVGYVAFTELPQKKHNHELNETVLVGVTMTETGIEEIDLSGDGGVLKKITLEGVGTDTPLDGCKVSLHYTGKLTTGEVFDSSLKRNEPFEFQLGKGSVIKAFDMGVATMKMGEKCVLTCAPQYAYGEAGSPPSIPPNSTLMFELEMLGWKGEDISPDSDGGIEKFIVKKSEKLITPNEGAHVKAHIIGKHEGRIFDERDVEFDVGEGLDVGVIEGVELGILKMTIGETSRFLIRSKYAFGIKGNTEFNIPSNAVVEYVVNLKECERAPAEWKLSREESIKQAQIFKEKGNNYLKKENYKLAIKMYNRSINYLSSHSDAEEAKQVKVACHLNIALSQQKLSNYFEAKSACNSALEIDPNNIKGIYRRGQSYFSISDMEGAIEDFQRVHELDPQNKAAINQITICKQKIKEFHEKEKKVYANMFSKFAAVDKQKETIRGDEPDVLTSCGEWSEEEARKEVDRAFERDENIFMINEGK